MVLLYVADVVENAILRSGSRSERVVTVSSYLNWGHRGQCLRHHWDTQPTPPAGRLPTVERGKTRKNSHIYRHKLTINHNISKKETACPPPLLFIFYSTKSIAHPFSSLPQTLLPITAPSDGRRPNREKKKGGGRRGTLNPV